MNASPATVARTIKARKAERVHVKPVWTSQTGDAPRPVSVPREEQCEWVRSEGQHVLCNVMADLPGDRSVGTCDCGEYIDTGTFNEREGLV
jgi:hypothetical protein